MNYLIALMLLFFVGCSPHMPQREAPKSYTIPVKIKAPVIQETNEIAFNDAPIKKDPLITQGRLIVIDPGHGGDDQGTTSISKPLYQEKSLNLITARFLKQYLSQLGYETLMTRNDDRFIPLQTRAEIANKKDPALFVSVHFNSAPSEEASGIEVFYHKSDENKSRTKDSKNLASYVLDNSLYYTKAKSRGVKSANYIVIKETKMPAVLVEGGFLTNSQEMEKIKDPLYIKKLAWGIAQGIHKYLQSQ